MESESPTSEVINILYKLPRNCSLYVALFP